MGTAYTALIQQQKWLQRRHRPRARRMSSWDLRPVRASSSLALPVSSPPSTTPSSTSPIFRKRTPLNMPPFLHVPCRTPPCEYLEGKKRVKWVWHRHSGTGGGYL